MSASAAARSRRNGEGRHHRVSMLVDPAAGLLHLRHQLRRLLRGSLASADEIRQARRAVRRLRLLLSLFREPLGRRRRRELDERLRSLGRRLGRLRDWDVLRSSRIAVGDPQLAEAIDERRHKALHKLGRWIEGHRWPSLDAGLKAAARRLRRRAVEGRELDPRLLLDHRWTRLHQQLATVDGADPDSLHALRQQVRKLRQVGRWSAELLSRPAPKTFMPALTQAQLALGLDRDARMARRLLARLDVDAALPPATAAAADARLIGASLTRLRRLRPYWQR